jgi:hypothetical protein
MMESKALGLSLLFCVVGAVAKDVNVRIAWTRTFPNSSLGIMTDNRGHIAATGTESTNVIAILLNAHGRAIARQTVPIPGITAAIADGAGRIFITGNAWASKSVFCGAFAPRLSRLLWVEERNLSNSFSRPTSTAQINALAAGEDGTAYISGNWDRGLYFNQFRGDNSGLLSFWNTFGSGYGRNAITAVRSRAGKIYFVGRSVALSHYPFITIHEYDPNTEELIVYGSNPPAAGGFAFPVSASSDAEGNIVIVGWYSDDAHSMYRSGNYLILKMDANLNALWGARYGEIGAFYNGVSIARAVAVTRTGEIVVSGRLGTVKYSRDGNLLWASLECGDTLRLDRRDNVLLAKQAGREDGLSECEITKLNSNGTVRWQTRFHDGGIYDNRPAGLVTDNHDNVYFSALNDEKSTIVKLVEQGQDK